MKISAVAPELRPYARRTPALAVDNRLIRAVARLLTRLLPQKDTPGVALSTLCQAGVDLRLYKPDTRHTNAVLLWFHGGGGIYGAPAQDDGLCGATARELGMLVVSASYRLAPENPFPAALDDAYASFHWLKDAAVALNIDPGRIVIGGQSAGGLLAAGLAQRLYDEGGIAPVAQWLFAPMLDDRTAARRNLDALRHRVWNNRLNRAAWRAVLGCEPGLGVAPPYGAPARRQDLTGLPPAWIGVGDIDLFFEEDRDYSMRLADAGVDSQLIVIPGAPHGFESWAARTKLATSYIQQAHDWLRLRLGGATF